MPDVVCVSCMSALPCLPFPSSEQSFVPRYACLLCCDDAFGFWRPPITARLYVTHAQVPAILSLHGSIADKNMIPFLNKIQISNIKMAI